MACGFTTVFGIFLLLNLILACDEDYDCYRYERCCKKTNNIGYGVCREDCVDFCLTKDDCLAPKVCDLYSERCSRNCILDSDCHQSYSCKNNECVIDDDTSIGTTPVIIFVLVAVMVVLCCCCAYLRQRLRRDQLRRDYNATRTTTVQTTAGRNELQPQAINIETVRMNSPNVEANVEANGQITPDAVALTGPPSYQDVRNVPEAPPPTYEEAMKLSAQNLSSGT